MNRFEFDGIDNEPHSIDVELEKGKEDVTNMLN